MRQKRQGFTLIELMIVVAIIAVLAAIAIPNLLRSRVQTNEASAVSELRTICAAQTACATARLTFGDFAALIDESDGVGTSFLDTSWFEGRQKAGYIFTIPVADADNFVCFADPIALGSTGTLFYRIDPSGVVRYDAGGQPDAAANALGSS